MLERVSAGLSMVTAGAVGVILAGGLAACSSRETAPPVRTDAGAPSDAAMLADAGGFDAAPMDASRGDAALPTDAAAARDAAARDGGGVRDASMASDGAVCTMVGDYSALVSGVAFYFRFSADGTWRASPTLAELATSTVGGTYTASGAMFTIHDGAGAGGCPATDEGQYTTRFDTACAGVTLTLVLDACPSRRMSLDGLHLTRVA